MRHVLQMKFQDPELMEMLLKTGNSFLLEHNPKQGRDTVWSNNNDSQIVKERFVFFVVFVFHVFFSFPLFCHLVLPETYCRIKEE